MIECLFAFQSIYLLCIRTIPSYPIQFLSQYSNGVPPRTNSHPTSTQQMVCISSLWKCHTALNPPSRLSTQLFAYLLVAKKTAASAISATSPKRDRGMDFNASERAGFDIALKEIVSSVSFIFLYFFIAISSLRCEMENVR